LPTFNERWLNVIKNCRVDLTRPINFISTTDIERYSLGWESRKMISIEGEDRNPEVFRHYDVFATPLSRTTIVVVRGKGFESLVEISKPPFTHETEYALPNYLKKTHGEANFLQYAFNCGLLSSIQG